MTVNTKPTPKKKPATPAESLRDIGHDIRTEAAADWKRWAVELANGEGAPDGRDLVAAAAALKIIDPANELQAAADAILEVRVMARGLADCERHMVEILLPFGGSLDKLLAALDRAQAEVDRLKDIAYTVGNQGNRSFYTSTIHQARLRHPHVWPDYAVNGKAEVL
jgi:hypothetical protein